MSLCEFCFLIPFLSEGCCVCDVGDVQEAVFKKEVEHLTKKSRKNTLKVERGFYTKENMRKVLGWNAKLVGTILFFFVSPHAEDLKLVSC